ncbi:MAG: hypothetical protein M3305_11725 [Actinomycetota bacterium]|nr:hypothetical protein [Actinomycetota bacterium]
MSEAWDAAPGPEGEYTVVGILNDGTELNQAVSDLRELGVGEEDLTVILKRREPDEPEPLPEGTRYIIVPADDRGLEIPIGFAVIFAVTALLFAFAAPAIGVMVFVFFIALAAILAAGAFVRVGVDPILIDMEVPADDSELWNEEFEKGRVLVFATTTNRSALRPIWEALRGQGADFYVVERRLEPQPVSGAMLHRAGEEQSSEERVADVQGA